MVKRELIFHATAPFSLFCDDGVVARPFWRVCEAWAMIAEFPEHTFRLFNLRKDGTIWELTGA